MTVSGPLLVEFPRMLIKLMNGFPWVTLLTKIFIGLIPLGIWEGEIIMGKDRRAYHAGVIDREASTICMKFEAIGKGE